MNNLDYGVIGNCKSAALISKDGSLDFGCLPEFGSSAFFAKLLDEKRGGHFAIKPCGKYSISQEYIEKSNVLRTRFERGNDIFELVDFMPRYIKETGGHYCPPDVIRYFRHISGKPRFRIDYNPRPVYGQHDPTTEMNKDYIKTSSSNGSYESLYLYSDMDFKSIIDSKIITLTGDRFTLISYNQKIVLPDIDYVRLRAHRTLSYWMT